MKTAAAFPSRFQLGAAFGSPGISRIPAMTPGTEGPRERMRSGEGAVLLALSKQRAVFFFLFPQRKKDKEEVYLCPVILSLF